MANELASEAVADARLRYAEGDRVEGALPAALVPSGKVRVSCDGVTFATVPVFADAANAGLVRFGSDLPPIAASMRSLVRVLEPGTGSVLAELETGDRQPKLSGYGLSAYDVLSVDGWPFHAVPWMTFDGAVVTISGFHLPPAGDPSKLEVRFPPGIAYAFDYPRPSQVAGPHFWYWPNAALSDFILEIDLAASLPGSDPFAFEFVYPRSSPLRDGAETERSRRPESTRIWIPRTLSSFVGFPRDQSLLTRVQTWSSDRSVTFTGFNSFRAMDSILRDCGVAPGEGVRLLDWGCGHGRVTRHFLDHWRGAEIVGMDIDAEAIAWCRENLRGGSFEVAPLWPPSPLPDASLDAVFGISVMTHLTAEAQDAWLKELRRLLKPGGLALITFHGKGATAWSSVWRDLAWWQAWLKTGFDATTIDHALDGKISDATYYRVTAQTEAYTLSTWSRYFEVSKIWPDFIGNLDLAVMRRQ